MNISITDAYQKAKKEISSCATQTVVIMAVVVNVAFPFMPWGVVSVADALAAHPSSPVTHAVDKQNGTEDLRFRVCDKLDQAKQTNEPNRVFALSYSKFGEVDEAYEDKIDKGLSSLHYGYSALLETTRLDVRVTDLPTHAVSEKDYPQPLEMGHDSRSKRDQSCGMYSLYDNMLYVSQKYENEKGLREIKELENGVDYRLDNNPLETIYHESSHAIDLNLAKLLGMNLISSCDAFQKAYLYDCAKAGGEEGALAKKHPYEIRPSNRKRGHMELWAELMAGQLGAGSVSADFQRDFQITERLVTDIDNRYREACAKGGAEFIQYCQTERLRLAEVAGFIDLVADLRQDNRDETLLDRVSKKKNEETILSVMNNFPHLADAVLFDAKAKPSSRLNNLIMASCLDPRFERGSMATCMVLKEIWMQSEQKEEVRMKAMALFSEQLFQNADMADPSRGTGETMVGLSGMLQSIQQACAGEKNEAVRTQAQDIAVAFEQKYPRAERRQRSGAVGGSYVSSASTSLDLN